MRILKSVLVILFCAVLAAYSFFTVRNMIHRDNKPPVISADTDELTVSVNVTDEELLAGMVATDDRDGDVTSSLVVVSQLDFIHKGVRKVNYAAVDSHNNVGTYTRTITYNDYVSPHFRSTEPFRYDASNPNTFLSNLQVVDVLDASLLSDMRITYGESDGGRKMPVIAQVTNSAGDTSLLSFYYMADDRMDAAVPSVALDEYIIYTGINQPVDIGAHVIGTYQNGSVNPFDEYSAYSMDNVTWDASGVDYSTPGEYIVTMILVNSEGERQQDIELYVIVEE